MLESYMEQLVLTNPVAVEYAQCVLDDLPQSRLVLAGLSDSERGSIRSALAEIKRNFPDEISSVAEQKTQGTK